MFPQPAHMIRVEDKVERLRKEFNGTIINYLKRISKQDHKEDLKNRESPHELLPQLTIDTLEDGQSKSVKRLANGEELNN
jgi:hypothetical protein